MTSELDIANRALGLARARTSLTSLTGLDPEVVAINLHLGPTREFLLRSFDWVFARSIAPLTLVRTATGEVPWTNAQPRPPWTYQYTLPTGCVTVRNILGQPQTAATTPIFPVNQTYDAAAAMYYTWEAVSEGGEKQIVTDAPNALCVYTKDIIDPNFWENDFAETLVTLLASRIVIPLSADSKLAAALQATAAGLLAEAKANAANEGIDIVDPMPEVLRARWSDWL